MQESPASGFLIILKPGFLRLLTHADSQAHTGSLWLTRVGLKPEELIAELCETDMCGHKRDDFH